MQFQGSLHPQFQLKQQQQQQQQQKKNQSCQSSQKNLLQQLERYQCQTNSSTNISTFQQFNCFPKTSNSCRNSGYGLWSTEGQKNFVDVEGQKVQKQDNGRDSLVSNEGKMGDDIPNNFIKYQHEKSGNDCQNKIAGIQIENQQITSASNQQTKEMFGQHSSKLFFKRKEPMNSKYKLQTSKSINNTKSNISTVVHSQQQHPQITTTPSTHRTHILMNKMIQHNIHQPKSIIKLTSNSMFFHPNSPSHSASPKQGYQNYAEEHHTRRKEKQQTGIQTQQDQQQPKYQQYQYFSARILETNKTKQTTQAELDNNSDSSGIFTPIEQQSNKIDAVIERKDSQFNINPHSYFPNQHKTMIMNPYKCIRYAKKLSREEEKDLRESSPVWLFQCKNQVIKDKSYNSATQTEEKSAEIKVDDDSSGNGDGDQEENKINLHRPHTHQVKIQPQQIDRFKIRNANSPHFFHQIQAIKYTSPPSYNINNRLNCSKSEYHPNQILSDIQQPVLSQIIDSKSQPKTHPKLFNIPQKPSLPSSPYYYYSSKQILSAQLSSKEESNKSQSAITPPLLTQSPSCSSTAEVTLELLQSSNYQNILEKQQSSPLPTRNTLTAPSLSRKRAHSQMNKHRTDCFRVRTPKVSNKQCLQTFNDNNINSISRSCGQSLTPSQKLIEISTQMENNFIQKNNILAKKTSLQIAATARSKQQAYDYQSEVHPSQRGSQQELHDGAVQPWSRNDSDLDIDLF